MIKFDSQICSDFESAASREWLETNGLGGFACSTISGTSTRRYHAVLTPATQPPLGRITMLSKIEETLIIDGETFQLSSNQFANDVEPKGYRFLKEFRLDPFPIWIYEINGIEIEKTVFMVHGANTTVCEWKVADKSKIENRKLQIELRPLLSFCDYHALQHEDANFNVNYTVSENLVTVNPYTNMPPLHLAHNAEEIEEGGFWYRNFEYAIERERGFDFTEDLFQPFVMRFDLSEPANVIASIQTTELFDVEKLKQNEILRRQNLIADAKAEDDFTKQLVLAADQFIVSRGDGKTVIAGYPWFSDWGRDTMIALNGLTLATNRPEIAKNILLEFSKYVSEGMIPNRFPDVGEQPEYNNVDGTLWYFEAIRAYTEKTGDYDFVFENLYEKLVDIILYHIRGTRFNIHVDTDGLLFAGEAGTQLTWMDAKYGDTVFTPRIGKPVEIQALWYNALKIMEDFAKRIGDTKDVSVYKKIAETAKESFNREFWNETEECLFDVINGEERDGSIRPNQIFAVSLTHAILENAERAQKVVEKIESELLTTVGLRSLSPRDERYFPIYIGSPYVRDSAYHQGTVWAWLIGGYADAYRKVFSQSESEEEIRHIAEGFKIHLREAGIGQISEIFDGNAPYAPRGCFAQAWSIAEVLRVLKKDG